MRTEYAVVALFVWLGVFVSFLYAVLERYVLGVSEEPVLHLFLVDPPPQQSFVSAVLVASFLLIGVFAARAEAQRKAAQAEIVTLNRELTNRVADRTRELEKTNWELQRRIQERTVSEEQRERLMLGLRCVMKAVGELIQSPSVDALIRNTVEMARTTFGVERCAIFLLDGNQVRGTYGTNLQGETTDERSRVLDNDHWREVVAAVRASESRWWVKDWPRSEWDGWEVTDMEVGWIAHTLIAQHDEVPIGVFCNDSAITRTPLDSIQQEIIVFYCSFLATLIEQKRVETALSKALAEADMANRLKSQFLANVSHEVRTPLNSIIGFTESILVAGSVDAIHAQAKTVLDESVRLLSIFSGILDHARMGSGSLQLKRKPLDLRALMSHLAAWAESEAGPKGLRFSYAMSSDAPPYVMGDALRLHQVLMNLTENAIKFTRAGSVRVEVRQQEASDGSLSLTFTVSDTGIGVPAQKRKLIFESFAQADAGTTRSFGGLGLGLTIAHQLVRLMGGTMGLGDSSAQGSTFWFTVPFEVSARPPEADEAVAWPSEAAARPERPARVGKILVAEDYKPNQDIARVVLESAGHKVQVVDDGEQAVAACAKTLFDLVILDVYMPQVDGYEAARRIREGWCWAVRAPILALTARADEETRESCREAGMDDVVTKPLRRDAFLATVNGWLLKGTGLAPERERREAEPPSPPAKSAGPLDYAAAVHQFGGNPALLDTVLRNFMKLTRNQVSAMREGLARKDAETVCMEAHRIRGAASSLTAETLAKVSEEMEEEARQGRIEHADRHIRKIEQELQKIEHYLSQRKQSVGGIQGDET